MKNINGNKQNKEYYYTGNVLADIMKGIAGVLVVIGVIAGFIILSDSTTIGVCTIISSLLAGIFTYSQAEKLDILSDIRENTEHLRDNINIEKEKGEI